MLGVPITVSVWPGSRFTVRVSTSVGRHQDVAVGPSVDQVTERRHRLEGDGECGRAQSHREVDREIAGGQRMADQILEPRSEQRQGVGVVGQFIIGDGELGPIGTPAERRGRDVLIAIDAEQVEAGRGGERGIHRLAEGDDLGQVVRGRREDVALVDRRIDDLWRHGVGREGRGEVGELAPLTSSTR